jgi:phosphoglycolate phosphatase
MKLVLFDIDGTLMTSGMAAREAVGHALSTVFGTPGKYMTHSFDGKTDPQIYLEIMGDAGFDGDYVRQNLKKVYELYLAELERRIKEPGIAKVFPGVRELLQRLREKGVSLGLLTGNIREGARLKLQSAMLLEYFSFGAFAECSEERNVIAEHALRIAREETGRSFEGRHTTVVGDSIHDIGCARRIYARSVAVATGKTPIEILREYSPDFLYRDFSDVENVLNAILG